MAEEVEAAGVLSLGGLFRRGTHAETLPVGTPCPNCATPLKGAWCYHCGQLGEDFHRSAAKLLGESLREFFDLDNRLWHTIPNLLMRPGRLTHAYLAGHRAPQVPPLRLFLVALVALFLVGLNGGNLAPPQLQIPGDEKAALSKVEKDKRIAPEDKREIEKEIANAHVEFGKGKPDAAAKWLEAHIKNAIAHQSEFWQAVQNWAERFAFLMLPLAAILMTLLFAFNRRFYIFDHIIFSMHSLSFLCVLLTATIIWNRYMPVHVGGLPLLAAPVHLFAHMRGVYQTSIVGTLLRMFLLLVGTVVGASFIVLGLFWVALSAM